MKRELLMVTRDLRVAHRRLSEKAWVLLPQGVIDSATTQEFDERLREFLGENRSSSDILLDVSGLKYVSSVGLGSFIRLFKESETNGSAFALYDPQLAVRRVLEISKLDFLLVKPEDTGKLGPFAEYVGQKEAARLSPQ